MTHDSGLMTLPSGVITFLFTDIQGSTQLWEHQPALMQAAVRRHDALLRGCIEARQGYVFKTVGDAFCAAFIDPADGLAAAINAQHALAEEPWHPDCVIRARMALHTGEAEEREGDYFGPTVNRVARLLSAGHGGQTLASRTLWAMVQDQLDGIGAEVEDMGEHRLKDLVQPEHIFQVLIPGLPREFPPLKVLDYQPTNLPIQTTAFVGRAAELAAIEELIGRPEVHLVTLVGPGGTGKTRLAYQAGAELLETFADGVYVADLAPLDDPALVLSSIANALHVQESGGRSLQDVVVEHLRDKHMLLLLDNFEQVLPAAPVVSSLLAACPKLTVLVTSRAPLRVSGEHEYPVPPLAVPPRAGLLSLEELAGVDAVALFVERARAIKADFALTPANAVSVTDICRRLEGLPLAIELAAARIRLFPPPVLLNRLSSRLKLLTGGARDLPARQQTLRGTIDWSYSLLDAGERHLFARLSVFAGGCTLEAAEAICNADGDLEIDVLDGIASLVEKSLLRQEEVKDEPRFVMLETLREYASERIEEMGETQTLRDRHAAHYQQLAEESEPALMAADQDEWLARLETDHGNLRAALASVLAAPETDVALRFVDSMAWFWLVHGYLSEARGWLDQALAKASDSRTPERARALTWAGVLALNQGDLAVAKALLEEGLELGRALEQRACIAQALHVLGLVTNLQGDLEQARKMQEESLDLHRELGDTFWVGAVLNALGELAMALGEYEEATARYEEALAIAQKLGQKRVIAIQTNNLACAVERQGGHERAQSLFAESLTLFRELGDKAIVAKALVELGMVTRLLGDRSQAVVLLQECLELLRELEDRITMADWLECHARILALEKQPEHAARVYGAASALRDELGAPLPPGEQAVHERDLACAREALGEKWVSAWESGRSMSIDDAIDLASAALRTS